MIQIIKDRFHILPSLLLLGLLFFGLSQVHAIPGVDQTLVVTAADTTLNRYAPVTAAAGNKVTVTDVRLLNDGGAGH